MRTEASALRCHLAAMGAMKDFHTHGSRAVLAVLIDACVCGSDDRCLLSPVVSQAMQWATVAALRWMESREVEWVHENLFII